MEKYAFKPTTSHFQNCRKQLKKHTLLKFLMQ